jgi:hypothetical protein
MATKKGKTANILSSVLLDLGSEIREGKKSPSGSRDKHSGFATLHAYDRSQGNIKDTPFTASLPT